VPQRTNEFQRLIAAIQANLAPGAQVEESAMLVDSATGTRREVDVCIRGQVGNHAVTVSIECRDRTRGGDVTWVDEMHAKHLRLPTNLLVLVTHRKRFSKEARNVAKLHGIRTVVLADVVASDPERLFPGLQSLWTVAWHIEIERVSITVERTDELPSEVVAAFPDNILYLADGTKLCTANEMATSFAQSSEVSERLAREIGPQHTRIEFGWQRLSYLNQRICLFSLARKAYRPIERFHIAAKCTVSKDEFALRHALFGDVRVAWGEGNVLNQRTRLLASRDDQGVTRLTLTALKKG
jgi:hypothetical protein